MADNPRLVLERLCADRGEDFASLSRLLGRNPAYVQQFVRRGVPKLLAERDRRILARYFSIPESLLGAPEGTAEPPGSGTLVPIPRSAARASAGPGTVAVEEQGRPYFAFDGRWLRRLTGASSSALTMLRVEGNSMAPTLSDGDDILLDRSDSTERLRDGIYVLRHDDTLMVKRLTLHPIARRVTVQSDNPAYADWPDCDLGEIHVIGRVIWAGRRIA